MILVTHEMSFARKIAYGVLPREGRHRGGNPAGEILTAPTRRTQRLFPRIIKPGRL
jgi:ABC-type polar amino acid transport system ATPase subunit